MTGVQTCALPILTELFKKKKEKQGSEDRFQQLVKNYKSSDHNNERLKLPKASVKSFSLKKLIYEFYGETFEVPTIKIFIISLIVGIGGGAYGIGGGAIMAPIYVAFFRLPVYTVAGPALMGTFITSVAGVLFYQFLAPYYPSLTVAPDWLLGFLFGVGGFAGMYVGASLQKYLPAIYIKWVLGIVITFISVLYISEIIKLLN